MRTIRTRQSERTIKTFDRADNLAQKTKNGLSEVNRTAEQLQDANAESGVDYAGSRMQEGEKNVGEYAVYGMERMGRWGMRVTGNKLRRLYHLRHRQMPDFKVKIPKKQLPSPKRKALPSAKKLLQAPGQTAKASMKASQKAAMMLKRAAQATIKFAKVAIKATIEAVKSAIAILKETIALIIAGGWVAVVIILIVCVAAVVGGMLVGKI
ncbi:MAG: hypothetical protein IJW55_06880 [Clostridia bacterium]|nr:hypothetical protein [Clostridia bacterium]